MTGLLHRLAARATGTGWTVRSDVRLPFGAAGLEAAQDAAPPLIAAAGPERHVPLPARSEPTGPAVAATPQAVPPAAQTPAASAPADRPPTTRPAKAARAMPKPLMPTNQQAATPRAPVAATEPAQPPEPALAAPATPLAASSPSLTRPESSPLHREEPAPLLPSQPHAASHAAPLAQSAQGSMPFAHGPTQQASTSRETEVHIHIGRIDVTALHEAARPKARPRERTQPVSLDAYLAARSKSS